MFLFKLNFIITGFKIEKAARNNHPFIPSFPTYFTSRIIRRKKKNRKLAANEAQKTSKTTFTELSVWEKGGSKDRNLL